MNKYSKFSINPTPKPPSKVSPLAPQSSAKPAIGAESDEPPMVAEGPPHK